MALNLQPLKEKSEWDIEKRAY